MGIFDGVKDRLGFGDEPEWQDDQGGAYDDYAEDDYIEEDDDGYYEDDGYVDDGLDAGGSNVVFDDYNPNSFGHVRLSTDRPLQVASYGDTSNSYMARRSGAMTGYGAGVGTSARRREDNVRPISDRQPRTGSASWDAPADPSFLGGSSRTTDPYSQFDTDIKSIRRDPAAHLEVVQPTKYADVEKIASAFKAGKSVVLSLKGTKPDLAKRILDFSFGVACALNGTVDKAADKVFIITKGTGLSDSETAYLKDRGVL